MQVAGRTVLVTGASRGIGEALARRLAARGARLVLVARSGDALAALAAELGGRAVVADLADPSIVDGLIGRIEADGPVDVVVHNAGFEGIGALVERDARSVAEQIQLNLTTPIELTRQVLPGMLERGRGQIVSLSSAAAAIGGPGMTVYSATKAGLSRFAAVLRADLRGQPVTVTDIRLGLVETDMSATLFEYPPLRRWIGRMQRFGLSPTIPLDPVADAIVAAIEADRRALVRPRRQLVTSTIGEVPTRLGEALTVGVAHQARHRRRVSGVT